MKSKPLKYRRAALRRDEMLRRKRWKRQEWSDFLFGIWMLVVFIGCPVIFLLGVFGYLD